MEKLKYIKIEHEDGTFSENVPIGADASNIDNGNETLDTTLSRISSRQTSQENTIINLRTEISSLASGSPAGVYDTVADLISDNPDHTKIYVVSENGHWYYYKNNNWTDGGIYQSSLESSEVTDIRINPEGFHYESAGEAVRSEIENIWNLFPSETRDISEHIGSYNMELGSLNADDGSEIASTTRMRTKDFIEIANSSKIINSNSDNYKYWCRVYDSNKEFLGGVTNSASGWVNGKGFFSNLSNLNTNIIIQIHPAAKYIRFMVAKDNDSTISDSDLENVKILSNMSIPKIPLESLESLKTDGHGYTYSTIAESIKTQFRNTISGNVLTDNGENIIFAKNINKINPNSGTPYSPAVNNGVKSSGHIRIYNNEIIKIEADFEENLELSIFFFNDSDSFVKSMNVLNITHDYIITNYSGYIHVQINYSDNRAMSDIDYSKIRIWRYSPFNFNNKIKFFVGQNACPMANEGRTNGKNAGHISTQYFLPPSLTKITKKENNDIKYMYLYAIDKVTNEYHQINAQTSVFNQFDHDKYNYKLGIVANTTPLMIDTPEEASEYINDNIEFTYIGAKDFTRVTKKILFERGKINENTGNGYDMSTADSEITDFYLNARTPYYIKSIPGQTALSMIYANNEEEIIVYEYGKDKSLISSITLENNKQHIVGLSTYFIKINIRYIEEQNQIMNPVHNVTWFKDEPITYEKNPKTNDKFIRFMFSMAYPSGRDVSITDDQTIPYYKDRISHSVGLLQLPTNYSETEKPIRMIIFCHSSGDYSSPKQSKLSNSYEPYIDYLVGEGYAVMDVWGHTIWGIPEYATTNGSEAANLNYGTPESMAAMSAGYKWVVEHYNIATDGVFVTGKSLGGESAVNLCFNTTGIPVLACGMLAPALTILNKPFGYADKARKISAREFSCVGETPFFEKGGSWSSIKDDPDYRTWLTNNYDKLVGYIGLWNGLVNANKDDLLSWSWSNVGDTSSQLVYKDLIRVCHIPIKIWGSQDDANVSYRQWQNFIIPLKNGQCNAELRTMPDGTGAHHSVDSDPNALKIENITTAIGQTFTNVPLAYVELINFFRRYDI